MSTPGVANHGPATVPVYNIRSNIMEATQKASSQAGSREAVAREVFTTLQSQGHIPANANFNDYKATISSAIQDRDNDGYYDIDADALASSLHLQATDTAADLQGSPLLETYFADNVSVSANPAAVPSGSGHPNPALATMSFSQGLTYFEDTYSSVTWNAENLQAFQSDMQYFMDTHFVEAPVTVGDPAAANPVNDQVPTMSDELMGQLSHDRQGRARIDCGVYADVSAQIFEAAWMQPGYAYAVVNLGGQMAGHMVAYGRAGGQYVLSNNGDISTCAYNKKDLQKLVTATTGKLLLRGMRIVSLNYGTTPAKAMRNANSGAFGLVRFFNNANNSIYEMRQEILMLANSSDQELAARDANKFLVSALQGQESYAQQRAAVLEVIDRSLEEMAEIKACVQSNPNAQITFENNTLSGAADITEYAQHFTSVMTAYRAVIESEGTVSLTDQQRADLEGAAAYFQSFGGNFIMTALANNLLDYI